MGKKNREKGQYLHDRAHGLRRRRPRAALLLQAELVERRADRDDDRAVERVLRVVGVEGGVLGERRVGRLGLDDGRVHRVGRVHGHGLLGADGHLCREWL